MDNLNWSLAIDAVIVLILLFHFFKGRRDGVVKKIGSLASLAAGLALGGYSKNAYAETVAARWVQPAIQRGLERARQTLGLEDLMENLQEILNGTGLPGFLKAGAVAETMDKFGLSLGSSGVSDTSSVIAARLSGWLLFLVGAVLAYIVVKVVFVGVCDPVIRNLPVIDKINGFMGAVLGLVQGVLLALVLLWLVYHLVPGLSQPGGPLSPEAVAESYVTRYAFRLFPNLFK